MERFETGIKAISWGTIFFSMLAVMESMGKGMEKIDMPSSRSGTMALLFEARNPEMVFLMRLMREVSRGIMDQEIKNREAGSKLHE